MMKALLVLLLAISSNLLYAQSNASTTKTSATPVTADIIRSADTLGAIVISHQRKGNASRNAKFSPGTKITKFTQISQVTSSTSLSDMLKKHTSIYIKEYGRGMSSYLSLRGTSSSHTSIDWNGQSLSVPTMGQTDLSHIPLYFFDNMSVHIGGSSALYGSGSLSGNIQLQTTPTYKEGFSGDITLKAGSFTTLFGGGTLRYSGKGWESRTSLYWSHAKNDFKFRNNTEKDHPVQTLNNAAYTNWGALQEIFRKFKDNSQLQISAMYLDFSRQIQPSVSNNSVERSYHSILDKNAKVSAAYKGNNGKWHYNSRISYCHDYELYEGDIIAADRFMANADAEYRTTRFSVRAGGSGEFIKPQVDAYASGTQEWRGEIFALALWQPLKDLTLGGGIRGAFVTGMTIPVQPALDIKYHLINPQNDERIGVGYAVHDLALRGSVSRSAKIPTLNDRYWGGLSIDLQAENSTTYEVGADYSSLYRSWEFKGFVTAYKSDVMDWIRWLPAGEIWRPQNVPKVASMGIESGATVVKKWFDWKLKANVNYTFTSVTTKKSLIKNDPSIGHQMAYQPKHCVTSSIEATYKNLTGELGCHYTGRRTSTDIFDVMEGYALLDFAIKYDFSIFGARFAATGEIKNILDTNYQNVMFYAMPGINFATSLQWKF